MANSEEPFYVTGAKADELSQLYDSALEEMISAINGKLAEGKEPRKARQPVLSKRPNGMPHISDAPLFEGNGPLEFTTMFDPPWNDQEARTKGKFPSDLFPRMHELVCFVLDNPAVSRAYMWKPSGELLKMLVTMGVETAATTHLLRFGYVASSTKSRTSVLGPILKSLTSERLQTPVVIPIVLVQFAFDRLRLTSNAILIRMSPGLQRARWEHKARAANGHDAVLAAATHALVLTNWQIANAPKWELRNILSDPSPDASTEVESFFAAFRLQLGIDTGYAQEIRLAKGWRTFDRLADPEVYAVGARRYPSRFDNYGWTSDSLPVVSKADMKAVAQKWTALRGIDHDRFTLALRRFNTAMTRDEAADMVLDATIALEVLMGDSDGQSISWKLRMRAAALIGVTAHRSQMEAVRTAINETYAARSAIVHGGRRKSGSAETDHVAARNAVDVLRTVINAIIAHPAYLDPHKIDSDLLLTSQVIVSPRQAEGLEERPGVVSEVSRPAHGNV